jgi:hypothetical protein
MEEARSDKREAVVEVEAGAWKSWNPTPFGWHQPISIFFEEAEAE